LKINEASMQGIKAWARAHPQRLEGVLNANPSFVFFREFPGRAGFGAPPLDCGASALHFARRTGIPVHDAPRLGSASAAPDAGPRHGRRDTRPGARGFLLGIRRRSRRHGGKNASAGKDVGAAAARVSAAGAVARNSHAAGGLARWRAPTVFSARIEDIRPENTVPLNSGKVLRGLFEITDFGRMAF